MPKFDCIQNHIILFIREYRFPGVENKQCHNGNHSMNIGDAAYVFNGEPFGLNSAYCSDLRCFLDNLDEASVKKYHKSAKKNACQRKSKHPSKKITSKE